MPETVLIIIALALGVAWVPVGYFFLSSWKARKSPLSLAIVGLIAFPVYTNFSTALFINSDPKWIACTLIVVNTVLLLNFWLCFYWQKRSFPDRRKLLDSAGPEKVGDPPHQVSERVD
jgi:hypothetical protein